MAVSPRGAGVGLYDVIVVFLDYTHFYIVNIQAGHGIPLSSLCTWKMLLLVVSVQSIL